MGALSRGIAPGDGAHPLGACRCRGRTLLRRPSTAGALGACRLPRYCDSGLPILSIPAAPQSCGFWRLDASVLRFLPSRIRVSEILEYSDAPCSASYPVEPSCAVESMRCGAQCRRQCGHRHGAGELQHARRPLTAPTTASVSPLSRLRAPVAHRARQVSHRWARRNPLFAPNKVFSFVQWMPKAAKGPSAGLYNASRRTGAGVAGIWVFG